jgi:glycosyltransferase involved in cell wall biosynthesis
MERLVCNLASRPELAEFEKVVCCLDEFGMLKPELEKTGVRAVLLKRRPGFDPGLVLKLAKFLRREKATVLHTHSLDPMFYGGLAAKLAGVRVLVHTQHDPLPAQYGWKDRLKFRAASKLFTRIVAVSEQTYGAITKYALPQERCAIVLNGIDDRRFPNAEATGRSKKGAQWHIGSVARLAPEKGTRVLLEAFARLRREQPDSRLVLVGDGPDRIPLEGHASKLGIREAVDFLGARSDIAELLQTFDLFVLPSLSEGIPLALLEAMAAQRAIVASSVGGVPEVIVDGESGLLVPPGDAESLAAAMAKLLESETARAKLAANATVRVRERFSEHAMAMAYRSLYRLGDTGPLWKRAVKNGLRRVLPKQWLLWSGDPSRPEVAITFDDGPDAFYTPRILDLLQRYGARATFFLLGERAVGNASLIRRIIEDGHEIGNHSYSHPHFEQLSWRKVAFEIGHTQAIIQSLQGRPCRLFRPPRGKLCLQTLIGAWLRSLTTVMWTADFKDFSATSADEIKTALEARPLSAGDIVLYHGHTPAALEALPHILDFTIRHGYRPVPVSELLRA